MKPFALSVVANRHTSFTIQDAGEFLLWNRNPATAESQLASLDGAGVGNFRDGRQVDHSVPKRTPGKPTRTGKTIFPFSDYLPCGIGTSGTPSLGSTSEIGPEAIFNEHLPVPGEGTDPLGTPAAKAAYEQADCPLQSANRLLTNLT